MLESLLICQRKEKNVLFGEGYHCNANTKSSPHLLLIGRYKVGEKDPDPKTWKANFRCAMNSLPDIEEVKDKSINKGSSAVRVYRMLPPLTKDQKKGERTASSWRQAGPTLLRQGYNRPGITDLLVAPGLLAKKKKKAYTSSPLDPRFFKDA